MTWAREHLKEGGLSIATLDTSASAAGMGDDSKVLQITAPVQPGNSGGPVLEPAQLAEVAQQMAVMIACAP